MTFDWRHYLDLAYGLISQDLGSTAEEARQRCALSRAYYSAFISVRNRLQTVLGKRYDRGTVHSEVRNDLADSSVSVWQDVASLLETMAEHRCNADYDNSLKGDPRVTVGIQLKAAEKALELADKL